jgi:hypothetical protein
VPSPIVPAIPGIPAGYGPVQADMDAWITTPFSFLASPTVLRAEQHAAVALTAATFTLVPLDTIDEDPWGGWSATSTGSQPAHSWLCPAGCSGLYEVTMTAFTNNPGSSTDQVQAVLFVDGANYQQAGAGWGVNGHATAITATVQVPLVAGADYLQFFAYSTIGVNTPTTTGQFPTFEVAWIST